MALRQLVTADGALQAGWCLLTGERWRQGATIDRVTGNEDELAVHDGEGDQIATERCVQIVRSQTQLAHMGWDAVALGRDVLECVHCSECLGTQQQEGNQQVGERFFHGTQSA